MTNPRARDLFCSAGFVLVLAFLVRLSGSQLLPTETRTLFQVQRQLEYPEVLQGWNNWTNFCYLPPSPSLVIVCSDNRVTELAILGNRTSPSRSSSGLISYGGVFAASDQTLSRTFSIDSLFTVLTKLSSLRSLSLVSLGLWGPLPAKINRFRLLESLDLSSNFIYGEIPPSVATFASIGSIVLADNLFNGSVPDLKSLGLLAELDLSSNSLGPEFPSLGDNLVNVSLRNNSFESEIPNLGSFARLQRIDISYNKLAGQFPSSIFFLPSVQYINLAQNQLRGTIPVNLSCNGNLTYVDISNNLLVGRLPPCMSSNSANRTVLSSWNCFSNGDTKHQHSYSYCQKEVLAVQPSPGKSAPDSKGAGTKLGLVIGIIGGTVGAATAIAMLILCIIRRADKRRSPGDDKTFAGELSFRCSPKSSIDSRRVPQTMRLASLGLPSYQVYTLEDIEEATNNFDSRNLITEASHGQIYKGRARDGTVVMVKCVKAKHRNLPQNLNQQMEILSKLRHRHLVSLLGHCVVTYQDHTNISSTVFILLEHVPNGSLKDYLTDWRKKEMLKWPQRMAIMVGIARGLQFLHTGVAPGVFGNDLKIENILLDDSLTAKISGYNIPLPFKTGSENSVDDQHGSTRPGNTKAAEEEDVYQLGKILLQIIIGKLVKSTSELDDQRLLLVRSLPEHPTQLRTATDPAIRGTFAYQSLKTAVEVAMNCLEKESSKRPSIEDVLWNLQYSIQVQEGWTSSENLSTRT